MPVRKAILYRLCLFRPGIPGTLFSPYLDRREIIPLIRVLYNMLFKGLNSFFEDIDLFLFLFHNKRLFDYTSVSISLFHDKRNDDRCARQSAEGKRPSREPRRATEEVRFEIIESLPVAVNEHGDNLPVVQRLEYLERRKRGISDSNSVYIVLLTVSPPHFVDPGIIILDRNHIYLQTITAEENPS